jgi:(4-O-methyl)-D-glucuronate---lignin esterase
MASQPIAEPLPDPFVFTDGHRVESIDDWNARRAELAELIQRDEYGHLPPPPRKITSSLLVTHIYKPLDVHHLTYKVTCDCGEGRERISCIVDLLKPDGDGPFPAIVRGDLGWGKTPDPIAKQILDRGYILADFNRCEFAPDLGPDKPEKTGALYEIYPDGDFGAIAAWAWGFSRVVDFLVTLPYVDKDKIAITGHSRGGKAALLAGAMDPRIALTAPNCSGCGGAGCFRFQGPQSETIAMITESFPTWFTPRFKEFAGKEDDLPFDQHFVKALVAPRALLSTEALDDLHANPSGSFQTYHAARQVYQFLGHPEQVGIWFRPGIHEHNASDFATLLDFADEMFFNKQSKRDWSRDPFPAVKPN